MALNLRSTTTERYIRASHLSYKRAKSLGDTPNCKNVVMEKMKKRKSQKGIN